MAAFLTSMWQVLTDRWADGVPSGYCRRCGTWGMQDEVWGCRRCRTAHADRRTF